MKKLLVFLCTIFLVLGVIETAGAISLTGTPSPDLSPVFGTLIDFDDLATGTPVLWDDYVSSGIASITETEGVGTFARYEGTQSAPNYVGTGLYGERGGDFAMGWDGTIRIEFIGLASLVSIGVANSRGGPEIIRAYASDGTTLLESHIVPDGLNVYFGILRTTADIKYFEITGDFFAIDDLQHNAIPEPATMLLLGSGLIGLAFLGRKKLFKKS